MRMVILVALLALGLGGLAGCAGIEKKVSARAQEKEDAWKASNPGVEVTPEQRDAWYVEADREVKEELAKDAQGFLTSILSGNWIGAIFAGVGVVGTILGVTGRTVKLNAIKAGGGA